MRSPYLNPRLTLRRGRQSFLAREAHEGLRLVRPPEDRVPGTAGAGVVELDVLIYLRVVTRDDSDVGARRHRRPA